MEALFGPTISKPYNIRSEDLHNFCSYTKLSPLRSNRISSWMPLSAPLVGTSVKLRSVALSVCCSGSNGSHGDEKVQVDKDDFKYLEARVVEAVSLLPFQGHLFMTLANGREVEVNHVNPPRGRLLYRTRNPTIFLKIVSDTELILPIIVGEIAVGMLMKALHGKEAMGRPNQYHLMKDLITSLNFEVKMVKVTERVADTYLSRIFVGRPGEDEMMSVDARPSDAINLAVRCKVPILVNQDIVYTDAVKPVHTSSRGAAVVLSRRILSNLDCPAEGPDPVAEEINLMKNMLIAVVEERYDDAARWRDELSTLRAQRRWIGQL